MLKGAWQLAGASVPIGIPVMLGFIRQVNTDQRAWHESNSTYAEKEEILGPRGIQIHREHYKPGTAAYAWMSHLNLFSDEVLPGWVLDFALIKDGYPKYVNNGQDYVNNGYRLVLRGKQFCFITDEIGVIYQAPTSEILPAAKSLASAASFAHSAAYDIFQPQVSLWQRIADFFVPAVYAGLQCCKDNFACYNCGCAICIRDCCDTFLCKSSFPGMGCYANIGCSQIDCIW
jgi:hypothetical protein